MARWEAGRADMERLIADKHLELVTGAEANGVRFWRRRIAR
jgi:hypothetical protein